MADYLPNRTKVSPTPYAPTAPAPFNTYQPTGGGGSNNPYAGAGGGVPSSSYNAQGNYTGPSSLAMGPTGNSAFWNPDGSSVNQSMPFYRNQVAPGTPGGVQGGNIGQWFNNQANANAATQRGNAQTAAIDAYGTPAGVPGMPSNVPPPPGAPAQGGVNSIGQGGAPGPVAAPAASPGAPAPFSPGSFDMQQFQQQLQQQFGMDANQFQQFLSWLSSQSMGQQGQQQQMQPPDYSGTWQGGN